MAHAAGRMRAEYVAWNVWGDQSDGMQNDVRDEKDGKGKRGHRRVQIEIQSTPCILHPSISFETQFRANQQPALTSASSDILSLRAIVWHATAPQAFYASRS